MKIFVEILTADNIGNYYFTIKNGIDNNNTDKQQTQNPEWMIIYHQITNERIESFDEPDLYRYVCVWVVSGMCIYMGDWCNFTSRSIIFGHIYDKMEAKKIFFFLLLWLISIIILVIDHHHHHIFRLLCDYCQEEFQFHFVCLFVLFHFSLFRFHFYFCFFLFVIEKKWKKKDKWLWWWWWLCHIFIYYWWLFLYI